MSQVHSRNLLYFALYASQGFKDAPMSRATETVGGRCGGDAAVLATMGAWPAYGRGRARRARRACRRRRWPWFQSSRRCFGHWDRAAGGSPEEVPGLRGHNVKIHDIVGGVRIRPESPSRSRPDRLLRHCSVTTHVGGADGVEFTDRHEEAGIEAGFNMRVLGDGENSVPSRPC